MLKSNVSYSTDKDSFTAGKACAEKAVVDLIEPTVAFVFSSVKYNQKPCRQILFYSIRGIFYSNY